MASTLTLTFNPLQDVQLNETLTVTLATTSSGILLNETFVSLRTSSREVTLATSGTLSDVNASNYADSWNLDHSSIIGRSSLIASVVDNVVTITLTEADWEFGNTIGTSIDNGSVTAVSSNQPIQDKKSVQIQSYSTDLGNECTKTNVLLNILGGNNLYNIYLDNSLELSNQSSPVTLTIDRGVSKEIRVVDTLGTLINTVYTANTRRLISSDITTSVTNFLSGTTLSISVAFILTEISNYEYSLNGVDYSTSNVFTGLPPQTYTIYVKDGFGCITTKEIIIDGVTEVTETVFSITEINPIRFFSMDSNRKNYTNTISCDELRLVSYGYTQKYLNDDIVSIQFKTNAEYINCFTLDSDQNTQSLTPIKMTENTGLQAKSTCTYFDIGNGRSAIYFGAVDLLDPITDDVIGNTDFGFTLPEWANTEGSYVYIDSIGALQINKIGYSDLYESFILEFDVSYTGSPSQEQVSANYNIQPYEVYQFTINMATKPDRFNIVIEAGTSSNSLDFTHISEKVELVEDNEFLLKIEYYDDENKGGMVYVDTGMSNLLRIKGYVDYLGEQTTEGYDGDKEYYVTDNVVYNSHKFKFLRIPSAIAHKLRLVMAHKYLKINDLFYKLAEPPEVSGDDNSNFKNFFVTLKNGGDNFLTDQQEIIVNSSNSDSIFAGIEASQGKGLILWTKTNA